MDKTAGAVDYGLDDLGLALDRDVAPGAALLGAAVAEQAGRDDPVLPAEGRDNLTPSRPRAPGSRHQHDRRPGTGLVVVDAPPSIFNHRAWAPLLVVQRNRPRSAGRHESRAGSLLA